MDNLAYHLSGLDPTFCPMFSMSTETVAYMIYPRITSRGGLPIYPGVCYEFVSPDIPATEANLLKPWQLQASHSYIMVVSDNYGLKRYDTQDMFECVGFQRDVPILQFVGRAGLNYSFTGEKITDQQLLQLYEQVRRKAGLERAAFTCFPKLNKGETPGYVFVYLDQESMIPGTVSAEVFDQALMDINVEYAGKRASGRLSKPELGVMTYEHLVMKLLSSDTRYKGANPAQFKPLPLYRVFWETVADCSERSDAHGE
jgi:hypothetical protein